MERLRRRIVTTAAASSGCSLPSPLLARYRGVTTMRSLSSSSSSTVINQPRVRVRRPRRRPIYITATRPDVGKTSVCLALVSHLAKRLPGGIANVGYMKAISDRLVSVASGAAIVGDDEYGSSTSSSYKGGTAVQLAKVGGGVVDGDVELLRSYFNMNHLAREDMSPTSIPRGYARKRFMIQGSESEEEEKNGDTTTTTTKLATSQLLDDIKRAYENIVRCTTNTKNSNSNNTMTDRGKVVEEGVDEGITIIEGTGHAGAGTIVGAGNACIAEELDAHVVLVADGSGNSGGIEGAFDELHMNRSFFMQYGVDIAGVIVNKVDPNDYEGTRKYLSMAAQRYWTGPSGNEAPPPILGVVPDRLYLGSPALADVEAMFGTSLLSGGDHRYRHYDVGSNVRGGRNIGMSMVTTDLAAFLRTMQRQTDGQSERTIFVSHVTRDDVILGFLGEYRRRVRRKLSFQSALVICTGCDDGSRGLSTALGLNTEVSEMIVDGGPSGPPILVASGISPAEAAKRIRTMMPKLNACDDRRVSAAVEHYGPCIDFDLLLRRIL